MNLTEVYNRVRELMAYEPGAEVAIDTEFLNGVVYVDLSNLKPNTQKVRDRMQNELMMGLLSYPVDVVTGGRNFLCVCDDDDNL